jgi:hypothetical protein
MIEIEISPLELDQLTRSYWGHFDYAAISQLAPLADDQCYKPKFYKAPASGDELFNAYDYKRYGLRIQPGDILYGLYLPGLVASLAPPPFLVQITDTALSDRGNPWTMWNEPIPSIFLANFKPNYLSTNPLETTGKIGSFPYLFPTPHPITGDGLLMVDLWDTLGGNTYPTQEAGYSQRIELVFGCLEVVPKC